jgi:hypothetical protein
MSTTPDRARQRRRPKRDSLRSTPAGAIWSGLPGRDQNLLLWLVTADIVTAELATVLAYGQLRTAQRRLARLTELGILRGFWAAGMHRPRGRHAYILRPGARRDLERIESSGGLPPRWAARLPSAPIHQLATHDVLATFLAAGDPARDEGLVVWLPERACATLFEGHLRPDALAVLRFGERIVALFVERDLGTEHAPQLADKIRRYRAAFARRPHARVHVGFVVESARRARTVDTVAEVQAAGSGVTVVSALDRDLRSDPFEASWSDGQNRRPTRDLAPIGTDDRGSVLTAGCLVDRDVLGAFDARALDGIPATRSNLG